MLWLMSVSLIDVVIFGTYKELVGFFLREFHWINVKHLLVSLSSLSLIKQVKTNFWITEFSKMPHAQFAIVTNRNNVMSILSSDYCQRVNWMSVTILSKSGFLHRRGLCSDVPLNYIPWVGCTDYDIWLKWIKYSLGNFILTCESNLGSCLEISREDVDQTVRFVISVLWTFAVTHH